MALVATVLADSVVVDALSNRMSLLNLFDTWIVPEVPATLSTTAVVTVYETEEQPCEVFERVRVLGPDGAALMESRSHLRTPARVPMEGPYVHSSIHFINGVLAHAFGEHSVIIEHSTNQDGPWTQVARRTVLVRRPPERAAAPSPTGSARPGA